MTKTFKAILVTAALMASATSASAIVDGGCTCPQGGPHCNGWVVR